MKIDANFNEQQIELLKSKNIDISQDFDEKSLEELEDRVYNIMMDHLDKNQDFTPKAEAFESILDIIVKIENSL
ncbi:MAG: hypothetical protein IJ220_07795 [Clostridia bacterium]|nr:hypothetical protein [Clostridia bacterium]